MQTVNLNFKFKGLDGIEPTDGLEANKTVANLLAGAAKGDPLKFYSWAQSLWNGKSLELDPSDTKTFKTFIEENAALNILMKAQILEAL